MTRDPYSDYRDSQYTDASPPVSPVLGQHRNPLIYDSPDISPIEEFFDSSSQLPPENSNRFYGTSQNSMKPIQSARVESPAQNGRSEYTNSETASATKWDELSGEPTHSHRGKPAQVSPTNPRLPASQNNKSSQKHPFAFLTKVRGRTASNPNSRDAMPPARPPWKGASGRSAIVSPPLSRKTSVDKQFFPPRKDSRSHSAAGPSSNFASKVGDNQYSLQKPIDSDGPFRIDTFDFATSASNVIRINTIPDGGARLQDPDINTVLNERQPVHAYSYSESRNPSQPTHASSRDTSLDEPFVSRFSATTFATTEAGSPPRVSRRSNETDAPPVPRMPLGMSGKRVTARKPTPSQLSASTSKSLPQSPPEMEASNRIEAMEAKLRDLARRRANINTIINELTQVIQPSSIAYDLATRSEVTKTVKSLNSELDDIKKEEHDVGLRLHRAKKKRDEEDYFCEPSGLWIKRVTS